MTKVWKNEDIDLNLLKGKTIAVIGYGSQGRAQALCMKESGLKVTVGLRTKGASWEKASKEGMQVTSIPEAVKAGDVVQFLIPDYVQPEVYKAEVHQNLKKGSALCFSHAFNLHYGQVVPPSHVDVIMIAPKAPGAALREAYTQGFGVPGLFAVAQNYSGKAREIALALGKAIGLARVGMIETTFKEEVETDLFGEQVVLCGGVTELIKAGFETLVEAGYQPEIVYYECLNELKLIVDQIWKGGLEGMWAAVSRTAEYGGRTRGEKIVTERTRRTMKKILKDVQEGTFAREWIMEYQTGLPVLEALRKRDRALLIEKVGEELRKLAGMQ